MVAGVLSLQQSIDIHVDSKEAQAPGMGGEVELMESLGVVLGLSCCLSKQQKNSLRLLVKSLVDWRVR